MPDTSSGKLPPTGPYHPADAAPPDGGTEAATLPPLPPDAVSERPTLPPAGPGEAATLPPPTGTDAGATSERVPGYEILKELGRGGMGVVYLARQTKLNRTVALKMVLAGGHAGPQDLARFLAEAEAVAGLQHPNIVPLFEAGEHGGLPYFTLEYVAGGSLAGKLRGTPLAPNEAARLVEHLAHGMDHAHRKGIVHRDLKPANVLLAEDGTPKVTDFGIAKRGDAGLTATGQIMGTPSYMAPEQAEGKGKEVGPAADVYALGAILYECLTGRPPFQGPTPLETMVQVVSDEPVPPSRLQPRLPRDLETVCLKCLQKEPKKRYAAAADLAGDLRRFQAGEPVVARPAGRLERGVKWARRRPAVAALVAVSMVAGLSLLVGGVWFAQAKEMRRLRDLAEGQRDEAATQKAEANRQRDRAERIRYAAAMNLAHHAWQEGNVQRVLDALEAERTGREDPRGFEWHYLWRLCHSDLLTLQGHTGPVLTVAFSADGKRLASGSGDGTVKVWDAQTGQEVLTLQGHTGPVLSVAFSPDGKRLASGGLDGTVKVWDAQTGQEALTLKGHIRRVLSVAFSPDGKRLASATYDGRVKVWDAQTGQEALTLKGHTGMVLSVAYNPDGQRLASASEDKTVKVWDARAKRP